MLLSGEIDHVTSPILHEVFEAAAAADPQCVVVDLCEVLYLDSTGIAVLYEVTESTHLLLRARSNSAVATVIQICGLAQVVELLPAPDTT
jgi:anti-anti-sigma factor